MPFCFPTDKSGICSSLERVNLATLPYFFEILQGTHTCIVNSVYFIDNNIINSIYTLQYKQTN